jgi:hypothetical protein
MWTEERTFIQKPNEYAYCHCCVILIKHKKEQDFALLDSIINEDF